jgi:hypothetical protein
MVRLLRVSLTGMLQFAIANASWIGLVRIISLFGSAAVAGYTVSIRIVVFFILPAWGLSNAAATLVGQNLGARKPERAAQAVWRTGLYNMLFLGTIGIFFFVFATPIVGLFVDDPAVVAIAAMALRTFSCGNVGYAYGMVMLQAFNGAGDTLTPTIVNFFGFWVLEIAAGLGSGGWPASSLRGRIPFHRHRRMRHRRRQHSAVPPRPLDKEANLGAAANLNAQTQEVFPKSERHKRLVPILPAANPAFQPASWNPFHPLSSERMMAVNRRPHSVPRCPGARASCAAGGCRRFGASARAGPTHPPPTNPFYGSVTLRPVTDDVLKLSLDDAIRRGFENNLGLREAESGEKAYQGEKNQALQQFLPTITLTGDTGVYQHNLAALGFGRIAVQRIPGSFIPPGALPITRDT